MGRGLVFIDPTILFMCLTVILERSDSDAKYFGLELTPYPTILFKDYFMRHPKISVLADALKQRNHIINDKKRKLKDNYMETKTEYRDKYK